jgi:large subunit ribosomal protein L4
MALTAPIVGGRGKADLQPEVFGVEPTESLLHEVVKAEQASVRQGTHSTRTRGEVAGGRAKPYRQKGTGRARQGTTRAAQFRGGGTVFGPKPRDYSMKVNRKAYLKACRMAYSLHAASSTIGVFDAAKAFTDPRTKDAIKLVGGFNEARPLVVIVDLEEEAAELSFRNLPRTMVLTPEEVGVVPLLWARSLLVSRTALDRIHYLLGNRDAQPAATAVVVDEEPVVEEPAAAAEEAPAADEEAAAPKPRRTRKKAEPAEEPVAEAEPAAEAPEAPAEDDEEGEA